ncbi:MAG: hypothetical protein GX564_10920 [Oligosphaeraceae bacterium]|nr:hypothetical protein [Oligosphaeraceae bacterium]
MAKKPKEHQNKKQISPPGLCLLLLRICRMPKDACASYNCKIAFCLLLANTPMGIGGAALCVLLHGLSGKIIYLWTATAVYVFSWLMLLLGIYLAGRELTAKLWRNTRRKIAAWKRLRKKLCQNCATSE